MFSPRRAARTLLREPLRRLARHEVDESIRRSPSIVSKVLPIDPNSENLLVLAHGADAEDAPDGFPLPPPHLHEVGDYVESGRRHFAAMERALASAGFGTDQWGDVLDFGCGSARLTRHLMDHARSDQVWGVDINAESIAWCEANLSPPLRFAPCSTFPHLPFEDSSFDLVYAGSVFTHISELAKTWLLELRRIVRPGGALYLTVQDQAYLRATRERAHEGHWTHEMAADHTDLLGRLGSDLSVVSIDRSSKDAMVYYDRAALLRSWGEVLEIVDVIEQAYDDQTAIILRKRSAGKPPAGAVTDP